MSQLVFVTNQIAQVHETEHDGVRYLVAPVVAIRAGVLNSMYVPDAELQKFPEAWNGTPVTLDHPQDGSDFVSAGTPDTWARLVPGQLWNVRYEDMRLKGDIWIDLAKAQRIGGDAMLAVNRLRNGQALEVSTGYFADIDESSGEWEGLPYTAIQSNIRPDHLALLLYEEGACNWSDGCGTPRVNKRSNTMQDNTQTQDAGVYTLEPASADALAEGIFGKLKGFLANREQAEAKRPRIEKLVANGCPLKRATLEAMPVEDLDALVEALTANAQEPEPEPQAKPDKPAPNTNAAPNTNGIKWIGESGDEDLLRRIAELLQNPHSVGAHEEDDEMTENPHSVGAHEHDDEFTENPHSVGAHQDASELLRRIMDLLQNPHSVGAHQEDMVSNAILNHPGNEFTKAELKALPVAQRRKLYRSLQARDYTGAAGAVRNRNQREEWEELKMPAAWPKAKQTAD